MRKLMINYTEDEKEYLREYLEDDGVTEDQWQDVELMQHHVSMCYDIDIQAMQDTGYPEESVKTSLSYIILEKLGYDFTGIHKFFNIFQYKIYPRSKVEKLVTDFIEEHKIYAQYGKDSEGLFNVQFLVEEDYED